MSSSIDDNGGNDGNRGKMKKFLFDANDFGDRKPIAEPAPSFTEEQLNLARQQARAEGKAEAQKEARQSQEDAIVKNLQQISAHLEKLVAAEERREVEKCIDATRLAMRVTHKLLPRFSQKHALDEILNVIVESIAARHDEPRIAVTVPTVHLDPLRERIDKIALEKGYAGKLILIADDSFRPSDCRVEWADGGAERLYERLFSQIENEFAKAIAGMEQAAAEDKQ